jgi:hypothetical protein
MTGLERVTVLGPNLPSHLAQQGDYHVHHDGCEHLRRDAYRLLDQHTFAAASRRDVAELIYGDIAAENDADPSDYLDEFYFAPCVGLS